MRKHLYLIIALILFLFLVPGCTANHQTSFEAVIDQIDDYRIMVIPAQGTQELNSADIFSVSISEDTKITDEKGTRTDFSALAVNQTVEISYNGMIAESYPPQISAEKIKIIG